jgi:LacI family transcriptional regulator
MSPDPRVKLADVARAAGVHPGTASRALNPVTRDQVSRETSRRVARAARRLGYVPNAMARGLRTARSHLIGMVVPDVTNPLFPPMVRGAERVLSEAGLTLVLTDTDNSAATERAQITRLRARGLDGFLVATARWEDDLLAELAAANTPMVLLNRDTASARLPYVGADERTGVRLAVDHLVALGHRTIAYLAGPQDTSTGRERASAFRQAIRHHHLPTPRGQIRPCTAFTELAGATAAHHLLTPRPALKNADPPTGRASPTAARPPWTAIVAGNDLIALGALDALAAAGLRCPADVSVVGFNDLPLVDRLTPPLTTVRLPLTEMGELAARTLLATLDTPPNGHVTRTLLTVDLAPRASTAPPPQQPS